MLLSLGTGYLLALAVLELLPHSFAHFDHSLSATAADAIAGAALVWLAEKVLAKRTPKPPIAPVPVFAPVREHNHRHSLLGSHKACCSINTFTGLPREVLFSAIGCIFVCAFFDGVTLSAALMAAGGVPLQSFLGVLAHVVPEVMVVGALARSHYESDAKAFLFCLAASGLFALGNAVSRIAAWLGASEGLLLGLAAGMMSYIAIAHLIPKFMSGRRETALAALGFGCFLLTELFHHHHV
jgi:zinc transporter ZupT